MILFPSKRQWREWSLPSRLTAIGAYVGVVSLLIAVVGLVDENYRLRGEYVHIGVGSFVEEMPIDIREGYGNHLPWQLTFAFPITMINEGLRPATIVNYELIPWNSAYQYTFRGQDGDQGLYHHYLDKTHVVLPFSIKPGEGKTLFLKAAIVVGGLASDVAFDMKEGSTLRELMLSMIWRSDRNGEKKSEDFFGNPIEFGIGVRGLVDYDHETESKISQPVYKSVVYTSSGKRYETLFAPYPIEWTQPYTVYSEPYAFDKVHTLQIPAEWINEM